MCSIRLVVTCVAIVCAFCPEFIYAQSAPGRGNQGEDIGAILATLKSRADRLSSFDIRWKGVQTSTHLFISGRSADELKKAGVAPDAKDTFPIEGRFARDAKGRVRVELLLACLAEPSGAVKTKKSVEVFDGTKTVVFFREGELTYPFASITSDGPWLIAKKAALLPVRLIVCPFATDYGVFPSDQAFLTAEMQTINDVLCTRLATNHHIVWLSKRDEYLPVRHHHMNNGRVVIAFDLKTIDSGPDLFPIRSWKQTSYDANGKVESETTVQVTHFVRDPPLRDSDFQIDLPPGTWVSDQTKKAKYLIKPDGTHRRIQPGEFNGSNYEQLLTTDPPTPPSRISLLVGLVGGGLVIVVVGYYIYWRRKARSPG